MKAGSKLKSAVDDIEVMVIKAGQGTVECGGVPMAETKPAERAEASPDHSAGTLMGKRYVDAAGTFELLCTKAGKASLSVDGAALSVKDAKPLPASD